MTMLLFIDNESTVQIKDLLSNLVLFMGTTISVIPIDIQVLIINTTIVPKQPITHITTRCGIIEPKICAYMQI